MAVVTSIEVSNGKGSLHPTRVVAKLKVIAALDRAPVVQIDTHGSGSRSMPGKVSQTLQFDQEAARQLFDALTKIYGFKTKP